jgi:hypothetical protein
VDVDGQSAADDETPVPVEVIARPDGQSLVLQFPISVEPENGHADGWFFDKIMIPMVAIAGPFLALLTFEQSAD